MTLKNILIKKMDKLQYQTMRKLFNSDNYDLQHDN